MSMRILAALFLSDLGLAAPPEVSKVDPPNWWPQHSLNPVRLLIRGSNLKGARVNAGPLAASNIKVNEPGTYLFVSLTIPPSAKPGDYPVTITTAEGSIKAPFTLAAPLPPTGRFQGFDSHDVIYLVMPDRFSNGDPTNDDPTVSKGLLDRQKTRYYHGGDLQGIINQLPYLRGLGITALWLNPVYDNNNRLNEIETYDNQPITDYHGYGATDFYAVEEHFGTVALLKQLVDQAHALGIKVIQDQVANHTGPYHPWTKDAPTPTWYNGTTAHHLANTWQTWTLMDPHASPQMQKATLDGWFVNILPDLNQSDPEVATYLIQNTLWWVGISGLDGIRQDTWPYVPRTFWKPWMAAIKRQYPQLRVVGELFDGDPAMIASFLNDSTKVDYLFDFPMFYAIRDSFAKDKPLRDLAKMTARDHLYGHPERLVTFLGLHDVNRFMNEPGADTRKLAMAFAFLFTTRGTPMIYYGDEIGLPGGNDPDNRRDFPGGWPTDPQNAFDAAGRTPDQQALWQQIHQWLTYRRDYPALRTGTLTNLYAADQQYCYARTLGKQRLIVTFNQSGAPAEVDLGPSPGAIDLLDGQSGIRQTEIRNGSLLVTLNPRSAGLLRVTLP